MGFFVLANLLAALSPSAGDDDRTGATAKLIFEVGIKKGSVAELIDLAYLWADSHFQLHILTRDR